jgi:hypothetical protein
LTCSAARLGDNEMVSSFRGLNREQKLAFADRHRLSVIDHMEKCTSPLMTRKDGTFRGLGSGVFLEIGQICFVLTAAHVIDNALAALGQGYPVLLTAGLPGAGLVRLTGVRGSYSPMPTSKDRQDDPFDFGYIELPASVVSELRQHRHFLHLLEVDAAYDDNPSDIHMVHGYPSMALATDDARKVLEYSCLMYSSRLYQNERGTVRNHDPNVDLLLSFTPDRSTDHLGNPARMYHPDGISGCGVWRLIDAKTDVDCWEPAMMKLVGIQHTWDKTHEVLRACRIRHLITAIHSRYEELRPIMTMPLAVKL